MLFSFEPYKLDIDAEKTKAFYENKSVGACSCAGCRNFEKAVDYLPSDIRNFFESLGVDIKKSAELSAVFTTANGMVFYSGFCNINGTISEGEISERTAKMMPILKNLEISFQSKCYLLEKDFPSPAIQMDFAIFLPWVIAEENPYEIIIR